MSDLPIVLMLVAVFLFMVGSKWDDVSQRKPVRPEPAITRKGRRLGRAFAARVPWHVRGRP